MCLELLTISNSKPDHKNGIFSTWSDGLSNVCIMQSISSWKNSQSVSLVFGVKVNTDITGQRQNIFLSCDFNHFTIRSKIKMIKYVNNTNTQRWNVLTAEISHLQNEHSGFNTATTYIPCINFRRFSKKLETISLCLYSREWKIVCGQPTYSIAANRASRVKCLKLRRLWMIYHSAF